MHIRNGHIQQTQPLQTAKKYRKAKYAYQKLPHSEDTASPHSQEEEKERKREHG
jgi:hypothetical protein